MKSIVLWNIVVVLDAGVYPDKSVHRYITPNRPMPCSIHSVLQLLVSTKIHGLKTGQVGVALGQTHHCHIVHLIFCNFLTDSLKVIVAYSIQSVYLLNFSGDIRSYLITSQ